MMKRVCFRLVLVGASLSGCSIAVKSPLFEGEASFTKEQVLAAVKELEKADKQQTMLIGKIADYFGELQAKGVLPKPGEKK